ncbi:MAG: HPr-rel-A system PqqD family peptide chaperone [Candidatus Eremiobacteraeota bacterium]|nr:HPr-rel-A system PqqD family peptide chaperone [Candidatus Eremiobacteraeota bacterium]MBC5803325.1 HPr-rel-A system PqqD family peptide chaperone [Candidatus Eremiobacteraeota bacterium]MBC5822847.1 HPr-rel-A system PqqD family peptide chaperone [Candidatus Eremiobacteraeota bacterium]
MTQRDPTKPNLHSEITTREVDEGLLVHDERSGQVHVLNRSAGRLLGLCDGRHDVGEIARILALEGNVDESRTAADVRTILAQFQRLGLLA